MKPLLFNLDSDISLASALKDKLGADAGELDTRYFPDGESYLRVLSECNNRSVIIFCNLHQPNNKTLNLLFLASTVKALGAKRIGLASPYLPYMRQDKQFKPGKCVSSRPFAKLLSSHFDWLVTLDPHLHRYHSLSEIYSLDSTVVHAAPMIAEWIKHHVKRPLLIGSDSESEQWVSDVAARANAPFQVLIKVRKGDYHVEVSLPEVEQWHQHTPVLVDDIISSGKTMLNTVQHLAAAKLATPVCIGVHGLFSNEAYDELARNATVVTCNCIPHTSNKIDISEALADAIHAQL